MSDGLLANCFWHALRTEHARFALAAPLARRYPADVVPFGGIPDHAQESLRNFASLLAPGEAIYLMSAGAPLIPALLPSSLQLDAELPGLQMIHDASQLPLSAAAEAAPPIVLLSEKDAADMLALTLVAFPGYFRIRTCEMGTYYGIRIDGELVAMAGERIALPGYREISAVCTHPAHTGKGYASRLVLRVMEEHARAGLISFLHVAAANSGAIRMYQRLGFQRTRDVLFQRLLHTG